MMGKTTRKMLLPAFALLTVSVWAKVENLTVVPTGVPAIKGRADLVVAHVEFDATGTGFDEIQLPVSNMDDIRSLTLNGLVSPMRNRWIAGTFHFHIHVEKGRNRYPLTVELSDVCDVKRPLEIGGAKIRVGTAVARPGQEIADRYDGLGFPRRSNCFRIPGLARTPKGTLVAAFDIRYENSCDAPGDVTIGVSRSTDGGNTWSPIVTAIDYRGLPGGRGVCDPAILVDPANGRVWIMALREPSAGPAIVASASGTVSPDKCGQVYLVHSDDDGKTWSPVRNVTADLKRLGDPDTKDWGVIFEGPGAGFALKDGTLVFPAQCWGAKGEPFADGAARHGLLFYSKDHGETWTSSKEMPFGGSESTGVQLADGSIWLNVREGSPDSRTSAVTRDLGETWEPCETTPLIQPENICQAAALAMNGKIWFSNPKNRVTRRDMTLRASADGGKTWSEGLCYDPRPCWGYSSLAPVDDDTIGVIYEGEGDYLYFLAIPLDDAGGNESGNVRIVPGVTGGVANFAIAGDAPMDWLLKTDGSQYKWIGPRHQWGNGYFDLGGTRVFWDFGGGTSCETNGVRVSVSRRTDGGDVVERYTFTNLSPNDVTLGNVGIFTPFNDNYTAGALVCMTNRCHAHVWAGGCAAWVKAMRMNGAAPHLGLVVTEGAIDDYDQWERGPEKGWSQTRGVLALAPRVGSLAPGASASVAWRIFAHDGKDFDAQLLTRGGTVVASDRYVYEVGETARVNFTTAKGTETVTRVIEKTGETVVSHGGAKAVLHGVSDIDALIAKRAAFILERQQLDDPNDPRDGAFMVYDNETDAIETNPRGRHDLSEGRERLGMGCFLAEHLRRHPEAKAQAALLRYAKFVREKLQTPDYDVLDCVVGGPLPPFRPRGYNYIWTADFHFRLYALTKDAQHARDGFGTLQALFRRFGLGFYGQGYPVRHGLAALKDAGLEAEHDRLSADFKKIAGVFTERSKDLPQDEMYYCQELPALVVKFLCDMHCVAPNVAYLDAAKKMMPPLEAFSGAQPHYRLNDIAVRHWDGYWFGKRQEYGDVFPHHWNAITAAAFSAYAEATGDASYQKRAEGIVRNNLCQFFEDGRATCAHLFPRLVNGRPAACDDAYANDQDWALVHYFMVNH